MSNRKRLRIIVTGRVQGVWFRQSTLEQAGQLGLHGWVRNLPDGAVEILAEGEEDRLQKLIGWCWNGPPLAKVTGVSVKEEPFVGDLTRFYIKK